MDLGGQAVSRQYAVTTQAGEAYTLGGRLLTHEDRAELEFLFPNNPVREVTGTELPTRPWATHPGMAGIRWPLSREDFR